LRFAVLRIERLFLIGKLPAIRFELIHFREFAPIQNVAHGSRGRPVSGKLGLVLGQIFLAVL
jgi:hypothetical protein